MRVAIVGCGIMGAYLGWKLSQQNHRVDIYERHKKVGKQACSGMISQRLWNFIPKKQELIENEITHCKIYFPKKTVVLNFKPSFVLVRRPELDRYIAALAKKAGARILLGKKIENLETYDRVIGCDGSLSAVRRGLGLPDPSFYLGLQAFVPEPNYNKFVETWPTPNGFIWKIPRGQKVEYGLMEKPGKARKLFGKFCKERGLNFNKIEAAIIPQGTIIPKNKKITLCGDAAGLTKPWSGGGVIWGLTAANILLKNFPDFQKYKKEAERFFNPLMRKYRLLKKLVYFAGQYTSFLLPSKKDVDADFL